MAKRSKGKHLQLGSLSRVAGFVRVSAEVARVSDLSAKMTQQQGAIAARGLVSGSGTDRRRGAESMRAAAEGHVGSQSYPEDDKGRGGSGGALESLDMEAMRAIDGFASNLRTLDAAVRIGEDAVVGSASGRATRDGSSGESRKPEIEGLADSRDRFARMIQQSSPGMRTLARIWDEGRKSGMGGNRRSKSASVESGSAVSWSDLAGRANRALGVVGRLATERGESAQGRGPRFERTSISSDLNRVLTSARKYISAANGITGSGTRSSMLAPASLSRPEFAEPMRGVYGQESRSAPGTITISSAPTVVVNAGDASGDVERQVTSALRAHREELFDQFKRESVRRERAQF